MKKDISQKYNLRSASMDDIRIIHQLEQKKSIHFYGAPGFSLERIRNTYETPGFNPETNVLLVENNEGSLVGLVEVWDDSNPPVHPYIWLTIDPELEDSSLEPFLLNWAEKRALKVFDRLDPDLRVSIRTHTIRENISSKEAKLAAGMKPIRHSFRMRIEMTEPPPEPVWPNGITLRLYDPEKDSYAVFEIDEEVFQDHFGFIKEPHEEAYQKFLHHMTRDDSYDPSLWFIAMAGDEMVGICISRKYGIEDKDTGYVSSLGVQRPWRRKGIATALLQHTFNEFYKRGKMKVDLGVDAESLTGATDLYQKVGMFVLRRFDLYEKELRPGLEVSVTSLESSEE